MNALTVFQQSFAGAERLLQQFQLAGGLAWSAPPDNLLWALPESWAARGTVGAQLAANEQVSIVFRSTARVPSSLRVEGGLDFLLRQAVVVACTALETFLWEAVRGGALTVVRARRRGADDELRSLTLTLAFSMRAAGIVWIAETSCFPGSVRPPLITSAQASVLGATTRSGASTGSIRRGAKGNEPTSPDRLETQP